MDPACPSAFCPGRDYSGTLIEQRRMAEVWSTPEVNSSGRLCRSCSARAGGSPGCLCLCESSLCGRRGDRQSRLSSVTVWVDCQIISLLGRLPYF